MAPLLTVDASHPMPLYAQLEEGIRSAVALGRLRPGQQLPTVRQLAVDLRVNANTVARVYAELERGGLLQTRRGVGTFVRSGHVPPGRTDRDRQLRELCDRFLSEARAGGFEPEDLVRHLTGRLKKER